MPGWHRPHKGEPLLRCHQLAIVWALWHLVPLFGLGVVVLLFAAARSDTPAPMKDLLGASSIGIMLAAAALAAAV